MSRMELELLRQGTVVRVIPLTAAVTSVGRHPGNDIVLLDPYVSTAHAVLVKAGTGLVVRDLRSRNCTWVNDRKVSSEAPIGQGDQLRFGGDVCLRVNVVQEITPVGLCVVDTAADTLHPVNKDRITFGSRPESTVYLRGAASLEASLEINPDGEVWLVGLEPARMVRPGEYFHVVGAAFRLETMDAAAGATLPGMAQAEYPYELVTSLDAPGGPSARLIDPETTLAHTVASENRATVLFVLARKRANDLEAGLDRDDAGWMDDDEVMIAIWGRKAHSRAPSTYAVLVHRIRRELQEAGFDAGFFERRCGACRLRLDRIRLGGAEDSGAPG